MRDRHSLISATCTLIFLLFAAIAGGCQTSRQFALSSRPPGATLKLDGVELGKTPMTQPIAFSSGQTRIVTASRVGFKDTPLRLTADSPLTQTIDLKPITRMVRVNVEPFPAIIKVDGIATSADPTAEWSKELEFSIDAAGNWSTHTITAERLGFQPAGGTVTGAETAPNLTLVLQPMEKDVSISSSPPDATVYWDGINKGKTPITLPREKFATDPQTNQWHFYRLKLLKPGYDPVEQQISWDEGQASYRFTLKPISKVVHILPTPANATIAIDGREVPNDADGGVTVTLPFPPDANGEAKKYAVHITRKTESSEWHPADLTIGWDDQKQDYPITLREVKTTLVDLIVPQIERPVDKWRIIPGAVRTLAAKDVAEPSARSQPARVYQPAAGTSIDSLAVSASQVVFSELIARDKTDLRAALKTISTDGTPGVRDVSDGKSLDLNPTFSTTGNEIYYSSDRSGGQDIWRLSTNGQGGFTQLTKEETLDLYPSADASNPTRLYYQGLVNNRSGEPRIYVKELGKDFRTELPDAGTQPRISRDNSNLMVCVKNQKTGNRDLQLYKVNEKQALAVNITNNPDSDDFDPAWSPGGRKIAFVSNRGLDEDRRSNFDIWVLDLDKPDQPVQITNNASWDDCPAWSDDGKSIYFRSNRGGAWAIWRIDLSTENQGGTP